MLGRRKGESQGLAEWLHISSNENPASQGKEKKGGKKAEA